MTAPAPSIYELAIEIAKLKRAVAGLGSPQLAHSSLHDGSVETYETVTDDDGLPVEGDDGNVTDQLTSVIGRQFDGASGITVVAGPLPPAPAAPTLTPVPGGVELTWDGTWDGDPTGFAPTDWTHCEYHLSTDPLAHGILFATKRGEITSARGGTVFVPVGGGVQVYGWLVARTAAGKFALGPAAGPVAGGKLTESDLDVELGTKVFFGDVDPTTLGTVGLGSLWLKEPENVPYQRVADDLGAEMWVERRDPGIASALSEAAAAQETADTKAAVFAQASQPISTGRTLGDVWVDTDDGGKQYIWDGAWTPRLIGNAAIEPNSLVASNVIALGTITGSLISATAIDGKTITGATLQTSAAGARVVITSVDGIRGINAAGVTKTQLKTDGTFTATDATISGTLRTAAAGQRVEMSSTDFNRFKFFTGDVAEKVAGYLEVGVVLETLGVGVGAGGDRPRVRWQPPEITLAEPEGNVALTAWGAVRNGSSPGYWEFGGNVYIGGRLVNNDPLGDIIATYSTATLSTTATGEFRLAGGHNISSVTLLAGRKYEAIYVGNLNAAGSTGRVAVNIRAALGGVTPTTASELAATAMQFIGTLGGPGQGTVSTAGEPFQVSATRAYAFHLFGSNATAGGTMSAVPLAGGHGIIIRDLGPADTGLRTLL